MIIEGYEIYEDKLPKHIAIIMDGNGRWAKNKGKSRLKGHRQGLETLVKVLDTALEVKIPAITVYAFSIENWKRPMTEIKGLMNLFDYFFNREFNKIKQKNVKIYHSGIRNHLDEHTLGIIDKMVSETKDNNRAILNLAINYSGRVEIIESFKKIISDNLHNINDLIDNITEGAIHANLCHPDLPDPDLLIRTSGELRISNFLLWQLAYSELYFTETLWPDFTPKEFVKAISDFQKRERRFGTC